MSIYAKLRHLGIEELRDKMNGGMPVIDRGYGCGQEAATNSGVVLLN